MFKLFEIEFTNHPFFNSEKFEFTDKEDGWAPFYTTLMIGPNGTGKSKLLLAVITVFNSLEIIQKNPRKKYSLDFEYKLRFGNNGEIYVVVFNNNNLFINNEDYRYAVHQLNLPSKILISAFSFNDKYPLSESREKRVYENYHYLGLKSTTNNVFIGNPTKNAVSNLYKAVVKEKDIMPLKEAFTTLELRPELKLVYKPGKNFKFLQYNDFFENRYVSASYFKDSFLDFNKKKTKDFNPELKRLGNEKVEKILADKDKIQIVIDYLHENIRLITALENKEILLKPILEFENKDSYINFTKHILPFQLLSDLEIVSFQRFEIKKLERRFSFDDASSGEYHIIFTFLNILSLIEENSLVLLDEPEISLHPNWQIKYMDIFNKIFKHFQKSHFIIATHSHFLVSDLRPENSTILGIDLDNEGRLRINKTPKNTYGWSAEQILLDVFRVATTRNYFLTKTITSVLKELSNEKPNFNLVKDRLEEIIFLDSKDFKEDDPIKDIFLELTKLYNDLNYARH